MPRPVFLGRDRELQLYQRFLREDSPWMLVITGLGGCGKSALLRQMKEQTPPGIPVVKLDFAGEAQRYKPSTREQLPIDSLTRFYEFVSQVKDTCDFQKYNEFNEELRKARKQLLTQRVPTYIGNLTQDVRLGPDSRMTDTQFMMDTSADPAMQDIRREARAIVTEAFYTLMDTFEPDRLVVMLDTCEWLREPVNHEAGLSITQDILLRLHDRMQQRHKQCHVVMAGTVELPLKAIAEQDQEVLQLAPLDEADVNPHLEHIGVKDPELRHRLYEITYGHPTCVSIISSLWQELKQEERPSSVAELPAFQRKFYERAVDKFIDEHILDERIKSPFDKLTRYGILLRSFNLRLLKSVFQEIFSISLSESEALAYFNQFIDRPYVKRLGNYYYTLFELLRAVLAESIRANEPDTWERYHKRALDFLTSLQRAPLAQSRSPDWYYHNIACKLAYDEEAGMAYWQEAVRELEVLGTGLDPLLEAARDETLMFTPVALAAQAYEQRRSS